MKKTLVKLTLLTFSLVAFMGCNPPAATWQLVWEENFDGEVINPEFWSKIPRGTADWNNYMSDHDACYEVKNGQLILRGMVNQYLPTDTAPYLTGGIYTKNKITFQNGRIEIKAKLHGATGAWPAIWMLPEQDNWPEGGEIDIMERLNNEDIAYQTVHTHYTYVLGLDKEPRNGATGSIHKEDYNVYAVELHRDSLSFYINDKHTFTYPRIETTEAGQFPFEAPFYLLIDMQLGGTWVGTVEPADLPVEMHIDWVRFYQK